MTDDEAHEILDGAYGNGCHIDWNSRKNEPNWYGSLARIELNGEFTVAELLAILHFAPKE